MEDPRRFGVAGQATNVVLEAGDALSEAFGAKRHSQPLLQTIQTESVPLAIAAGVRRSLDRLVTVRVRASIRVTVFPIALVAQIALSSTANQLNPWPVSTRSPPGPASEAEYDVIQVVGCSFGVPTKLEGESHSRILCRRVVIAIQKSYEPAENRPRESMRPRP
jgi:hypothetical protein